MASMETERASADRPTDPFIISLPVPQFRGLIRWLFGHDGIAIMLSDVVNDQRPNFEEAARMQADGQSFTSPFWLNYSDNVVRTHREVKVA
jgi:hypothetical protein